MDTVKTFTIHAVEPKAETGTQVVSFRRKKVAEDQAFRAVIVPQYLLPQVAHEVPETQQVFLEAISQVVSSAASSILRKFCDEKKDAKEIPAEFLSFAAIVTEMQTQQTSQRLNGETIAAWYDSSKTKEEAAARYGNEEKGQKQQASLREKYLSLASNNPAIPQALAVKMLAYISTSDAEHTTCKAVCKRLEKLMQSTPDADEL